MGCDQYGIQAQLYFDNELRGLDLEDFRHHLSGCQPCLDYLHQLRDLLTLLEGSRPLFVAPDGLRSRVTEEITKWTPFADKTSVRPTGIRDRKDGRSLALGIHSSNGESSQLRFY